MRFEKLFGGQFQWMTKCEFTNKFDMKHDYEHHSWTNAHLDEGLERCNVALVVIKTSQTPSLGLAVSGVCCPSQALKHVNKICKSNYTLKTHGCLSPCHQIYGIAITGKI